jgi:glycosyltransferase involved in cell wall biosynthesis
MKVSIITPSFRNSAWLKLCIASIADQEGVQKEHIVQDSCSDDGTQEWLPQDTRVKAFIEKDQGMYDAVNRGLRRATGEILAYLNCDEQYLPGALQAVVETFDKNPGADIVLADTVIVDSQAQFICFRKSLVPWQLMKWTYMPTLTSSIFFRRRALEEFNLYFDTRWREMGDAMWMKDAMDLRVRMTVLRRYTSIFTETGDNLFLKANALKERRRVARITPGWARGLRWPLHQLHRVRALAHRLYRDKPFSYSIYTLTSPQHRVDHFVSHPTGIWWGRHEHAKPLKAV